MDVKLPKTEEEWAAEFEAYKQYPEYQVVNQQMDMDKYKEIYRN